MSFCTRSITVIIIIICVINSSVKTILHQQKYFIRHTTDRHTDRTRNEIIVGRLDCRFSTLVCGGRYSALCSSDLLLTVIIIRFLYGLMKLSLFHILWINCKSVFVVQAFFSFYLIHIIAMPMKKIFVLVCDYTGGTGRGYGTLGNHGGARWNVSRLFCVSASPGSVPITHRPHSSCSNEPQDDEKCGGS